MTERSPTCTDERAMRLISHSFKLAKETESPFLVELQRVAHDSSLDLVCPYMSVDILDNLVKQTARIRIVTDAEEWLRSHARSKRRAIIAFLGRHKDSVRHYRGVHAKAAMSTRRLFFGSANFTASGFGKNEELSGASESEPLVAAARAWFDDIWVRAVEIDLAALRAYETSLPAASAESGHRRLLPPPFPRARHTSHSAASPSLKSEQDLVRYLQAIPDGTAWVNDYLDLVRLVYEELDLDAEDPRASLTMPRSGFILPLSINNRYSLFPIRDGKRVLVGVLVPNTIAEPGGQWRGGEFLHLYDPTSKDEGSPPIVIGFPRFDLVRKPTVVDAWRSGMTRQLQYAKRSSNRRYHSAAALRACLDLEYRRSILEKAYHANDN